MTKRSILGLLYASKFYADLGIDTTGVFRKHSLPLTHMDESATIERSKELEVIIDLFRLKPEPELGLMMGSNMGLAGYGPLSMLVMTCENAYEACQMGIRYQELTYLFGHIKIDLGTPYSSLILEPATLPEDIRKFILYRDMAGTLKFFKDIQQMNGQRADIHAIELTTEKPDDMDKLTHTFPCPIKFDQAENRITLSSALLNTPYPQANKMALNIYKEKCDLQLIETKQESGDLKSQLKHYLAMFSYQLPSVCEAAQYFDFPERSFRRQLSLEQTSYQKVLDEVRFEKAQKWLKETTGNIESIASKLGYQEAAAFNHAFKRWAGCTPTQYRKAHSLNI